MMALVSSCLGLKFLILKSCKIKYKGYFLSNLKNLLKQDNISSQELVKLLEARKNGQIDFKLIDIREPFEYKEAHIVGTDELLPTSRFQEWASQLIERKDENMIIYCRTGNRTGQVQAILRQNGLSLPHLTYGIMSYGGEIEG